MSRFSLFVLDIGYLRTLRSLKFSRVTCHEYLAIKLEKCGRGQIIQVNAEAHFLGLEMKKIYFKVTGTSAAPTDETEKIETRLEIDSYQMSECIKNENSLVIHVSVTTFHVHHNHSSRSFQRKAGHSQRQAELLATQLQNLWPNSKFSDITLVTESGTSFPASKIILAANSPVFCAMFNSEMKEARENQVKISGFSDQVLKGFLEFLYVGTIHGHSDDNDGGGGVEQDDMLKNAAELLKFSDKYDVKELKESCERILIANLKVENAADLIYLASFFNALKLKEKVIQFFQRYRKEIQNTQSFQQMKKENPQVLLKLYDELF